VSFSRNALSLPSAPPRVDFPVLVLRSWCPYRFFLFFVLRDLFSFSCNGVRKKADLRHRPEIAFFFFPLTLMRIPSRAATSPTLHSPPRPPSQRRAPTVERSNAFSEAITPCTYIDSVLRGPSPPVFPQLMSFGLFAQPLFS